MTDLSVLLVEDEESYAAVVNAELVAAPVRVRHAPSLDSARGALEQHHFDAIILDLNLPDSAGVETVERVRRLAPEVPIVVLTASDDEATSIAAVQSGADDCLRKHESDGTVLVRALRYATERAALRESLRRSETQLRQAQRMEAIGRLAGGVAHDFNNVLTAIFGYADLLLAQFSGDDPRRDDVLEIRRSAERAASLTRQLLAFSRKQVMQPRTVDLNDIVASLQRLMARLVGEDVSVDVRLASGPLMIRADPAQIEQVLMNLAANARDAMPGGGGLCIETRAEQISADRADRPGLRHGHHVMLQVRDTGIGMPEDVRDHVFEPFFTTKEHGKGTGLGLAMVYGVVKQSGGFIYADSESGKGSTFAIYLPADQSTSAVNDE